MSSEEGENLPLTSLLPTSSYLLAYSIPLLLLSVVLTFAGAFLTLDRSRQFAPHYDTIPGSYQSKKKKVRFTLDGGVGGLIIGYAFGVHLSTFLSLLIPAESSAKPLGSKSFVAVWLLPTLLTTFVGGRWRYCALAFAGITGGTLFSLGLCVIIHPNLLTRIIFTLVIMPILTVVTLLPLPKIQHTAVRFATASAGAVGLCISIGLLAGIPAWANVWERYWVKDGIDWGTTKEKGLSAGFCLFLAAGIVSDWVLKRTFGECPDEKWDSYLAKYATNLPDRSGKYQPFVPFWKRAFAGGGATDSKDILFSPGETSPGKLHKHDPFSPDDDDDLDGDASHFKPSPGFLLKGHTKAGGHKRFHARKSGHRHKREGVKFRPSAQGEFSSDSDSEDEDDWKAPGKPWLKQRPSMSSTTTTPTLVGDENVDYEKDIKKLMGDPKTRKVSAGLGDGEVPEYSDYEGDVTSASKKKSGGTEAGGKEGDKWSPGFLKNKKHQHHHQRGAKAGISSSTDRTVVEPGSASPIPPPPGAVPATPSLIKALDRIAVAQKDAFRLSGLPSTTGDQDKEADGGDQGRKWDEFWKGVKANSAAYANATNANNVSNAKSVKKAGS